MQKISIRHKICLTPDMFTSDIYSNLHDKIGKLLNGSCTKKYGYIISTNNDIEIVHNEVSENGSIVFDVKFSINALKPKKGLELEGKTCMIFPGGVFVEVQGLMKVLIPQSRLGDMKYDDGVFRNEKNTISMNQTIKIKIDQIKYEKRSYQIIGDLIV